MGTPRSNGSSSGAAVLAAILPGFAGCAGISVPSRIEVDSRVEGFEEVALEVGDRAPDRHPAVKGPTSSGQAQHRDSGCNRFPLHVGTP